MAFLSKLTSFFVSNGSCPVKLSTPEAQLFIRILLYKSTSWSINSQLFRQYVGDKNYAAWIDYRGPYSINSKFTQYLLWYQYLGHLQYRWIKIPLKIPTFVFLCWNNGHFQRECKFPAKLAKYPYLRYRWLSLRTLRNKSVAGEGEGLWAVVLGRGPFSKLKCLLSIL